MTQYSALSAQLASVLQESSQMKTINEKRQHNLRLPISRIPNEILSTIFCDLRSNFKIYPRQHGLKRLKVWVTITFVCHAWREVALNTSLLWCHIDVSSPFHRWMPELLRRSQESLLTIYIDWVVNFERGFLEEVKKHFGRTRELALDGLYIAIMYEIFSSESQTNFQNLEVLDIFHPYATTSRTSFLLNDSYLRAERLRSLRLCSCAIDWNSKFLQGLTHLRLVGIPNGCRLGPYAFTLVLSKIPALKTLHLSDFFLENEVQTHRATKIHLQYLQRLHMESQVPEMAQFLSSLVVPRSCKLSLRRSWSKDDAICDNFRVILSWISNHFRVPTTPSDRDPSDHEQCIRSFRLDFDVGTGMEDFKIEGFSDVLSLEQLNTADPILEFIVDWSYEDGNIDINSRTFLSLLPLSCVTFLDVYNSVELSDEFWMVAFGSIKTLKTVYLGITGPHFWQFLMTPVTGDNGTTIKSLPFPALASVTVEEHYPDLQLILDTLRVRSELGGTQLQDLCFSSRSVGVSAPMIQLGELVSHVEYDESER